jgi:hypothetical protein
VYVDDLDIPLVKITEAAQRVIDRAVEEVRMIARHDLVSVERTLSVAGQAIRVDAARRRSS